MSTLYKVGEAAKKLRVSVKTMQRWDRDGKLVPSVRSPTNRRLYTDEDLFGTSEKGETILYCRVSSANQKQDLENQVKYLEQYSAAKGYSNISVIKEVGGGLNFERKKFNEILRKVENREVKILIVAHKDRLARFGFSWFERFCKEHGCTIEILNSETLSPEQEMVQDLLTIIHCFSARLYGLRNYKKKLNECLISQNPAPNKS